jgi:hypothetical protein
MHSIRVYVVFDVSIVCKSQSCNPCIESLANTLSTRELPLLEDVTGPTRCQSVNMLQVTYGFAY